MSSSAEPPVNVMNVVVIAELKLSAVSVSIDENRLDCRRSVSLFAATFTSSTGVIVD